ncbi:glycosyltransferase family 2 protein [Elusimicrobiota bacterium]|jgi:glycosyltransferase involved in cell wall biosynthesis
MQISLITTTYNRPEVLKIQLHDIFNQSVLPDEIIIADDGSIDITRKMISEESKHTHIPIKHVWHEDTGWNVSTIRNKAIAVATGDYIILVDDHMGLHHNFIKDHLRHSMENIFIQGSRVMLGENITRKYIDGFRKINIFSRDIENRLKAFYCPVIDIIFAHKTRSLKSTKTCNMSFWKKNALKVNGLNEDFVGWGREDTEFAARLINSGILRTNIKFSATTYHLYHKRNNNVNKNININESILNNTIINKLTRCGNGIDKHIDSQNRNFIVYTYNDRN